MKKAIVYFCSGEISQEDWLIKKLDSMSFDIHFFGNVNYKDIKNIDIEYIISKINNIKNQVYIMSDEIKIISELFAKYSWEYGAFIYNNYSKDADINYKFSKNSLAYNYNFYCIDEITTNIKVNYLKKEINFGITNTILDNFLTSINEFIDNDCKNDYELLENKAELLEKSILSLENSDKDKIQSYININLKHKNSYFKVYTMSFIIKVFRDKKYVKEILKLILKEKEFSINTKYFLLYQIKNTIFSKVIEKDDEVRSLIHNIYKEVFDYYNKRTKNHNFIYKMDRDKQIVFVMISQFLDLNNGPTKTVLDRIYVLSKKLNKKVVLLNTRECLSTNDVIPIYKIDQANFIEEYKNCKKITYKDVEIEFYQSQYATPNIHEYNYILDMIFELKPYMIFGIGEMVLSCDLCSKIVPTISIPLGNELPESFTTFKSTYSENVKYNDKSIISSKFTFDLKKQNNIYSRKEFSIPKDKFVLGVVGGRLESEIDEGFLEVLDYACSNGTFVVFIGGYCLKDCKNNKYINLLNNSKNLGYQGDILGILELIDLYLNPKRLGGGTSGVEALYKKKPVISLNYGDVATVVGKDFLVANFKEMKELILNYKENDEFYIYMSKKSRLISRDLLNTEKYFSELYEKIIKSNLFV
ncbi:glycosyltransferase family 1 protein [Clostridium butyricum]|uniref:Glycosyl transferase, group 1 family n=1 Tax=Clostridium butyricum E4 str. BoNT E BL5262 TaxID=632245 RepID=C4IDN6_CLOBU|nr:glycosyltransferase family 1 protein [Clostridium butyricum]APF24554.1 glycosyl transferase, group 1 family [Clostridium butyricum]EDT75318.1 glycosyl transferase, group 1 family protein [Clostridium butyricum 5521]EEP55197.1 glycosyl transferase, group 1 family [Clostridium butyricum E4 str. BoNT E BL5262]NFL31544.1 glycosyltransferase family 1 protein [Clostridium butyricum]NFS18188.1 glycosyltransferase family 1 protein [Clostridium butyricum]